MLAQFQGRTIRHRDEVCGKVGAATRPVAGVFMCAID